MKIDTNKVQEGGFTIVELLTVMGIIAILIGLLVPALAMVKDYAKQVQQAAQFHSIDVGLDLYKAEFGSYPPSNDNSMLPKYVPDPTPYCGANKLAESMVGLDFLGFHPNSEYRATGEATIVDRQGISQPNIQIYSALNGIASYQTPEENVRCRGGKFGAPFVELENANAFRMGDVFTPAQLTVPGNAGTFFPGSMILCDVYAKKRNAASAQKAGMPILYYRARTQFIEQDSAVTRSTQIQNVYGGIDDDIYFYPDNQSMLLLKSADVDPQVHPLALNGGVVADWLSFENVILNRQVSSNVNDLKRPYRAQSYILISAGKDGLYGTSDDITNFKKE